MSCVLARMKGSALCSAITSVVMWEWEAKRKGIEEVWFHLGAVYTESQEPSAHTHSPQTAAS